jgi:hypothetical protein
MGHAPAPGAKGSAKRPWGEGMDKRVQGVTKGVSACSPFPRAPLIPHPNPAEPKAPPIGGNPPATNQPGGRPAPVRIGPLVVVPTRTPTGTPTTNPGNGRPSGLIRIGGK